MTARIFNPRPAVVDDPLYVGFSKRHLERCGEQMVRQMANYTPQALPPAEWARIEWYVRDVMARTMDPRHKDPISNAWTLARYVHWAHVLHGHPLEDRTLFAKRLIVAFTERALADRPHNYISSERARLFSIAKKVNPDEKPLPSRNRARVSNPPYTPAEISQLWTTARTLISPYGRRSICLIMALSAGAGLNPSDYLELRNRDIEDDGEGLIVNIPGCPQVARTTLPARRVPVTRDWEARLRELMADPGLDPDEFVTWPRVTDNRPNLQAITAGLGRHIPDRSRRPVINRLRTTWLVGHLQAGIPADVICHGAGYSTVESLARYMQYIESPDLATQTRLLRGDAPSGR